MGVLQYKVITVDAVDWTPITAPINCEQLTILNLLSVNLLLRTNSADAATEKTLAAAEQEVIQGSVRYGAGVGGAQPRFRVGAVVLYAKAASGTGSIHVGFLE